MLDTTAIEQLVKQQIAEQVTEQISVILSSDEWLSSFEQQIIEYVQARVMAKFANAEYLPEITDTVKASVNELFRNGVVPGVDQYVDTETIKRNIDAAVEQLVDSSIDVLGRDPVWLAKVEQQINQTVVDRVTLQIGQIDLVPVIKQRIDEHMGKFQQNILDNFASTGISDQSSACQLTITDDATTVANQLASRDLAVANIAVIQDLVVKGTVNIDNPSWDSLAEGISEKTIARLSDEWRTVLTAQVAEQIKSDGINFDSVRIDGEPLVNGNALSRSITDTNIRSVGVLNTLTVAGESVFNNETLSVLNKRIGVNTTTPEMALSVWDEEVSIVVGKNKANEAYIGTNRDQGVAIGVNRQPQIELTVDGLTRIKQLQIGLHRVGHAAQVPGYAGTRGDIVFNSNPDDSPVFAWVCLGAHRWKTLKSA
jgi:hypothetical protein